MPMGIDKARHERPAAQINHLRVISGHGQHGLRTPYCLYHPVAHANGFSDATLRIHGQNSAVDVDFVMRRRNGARHDREKHSETA